MTVDYYHNDYRVFTNFVNELEKHQRNSDNFFNMDLLKIIHKHFNYGDTCIAIHDNHRYVGTIALNRVIDLIPVYADSFHKKDSLAQYINKEVQKKQADFRTVVKSTDVFPGNSYDNSDYAAFLGVAGLRYAAILPFGDFRLCLYKSDEDFSNAELEILTSIYSILFNKLESFYRYQNGKYAGDIKNKLFDNLKLGFMVFDADYAIVEFNQTAVEYYNKLFNKNTLLNVFTDILSIFRGSNSPEKMSCLPISQQFKEFSITISGYSKVDNMNIINRFYYVIIEKRDTPLNLIPGQEKFEGFTNLSRREVEILEAFCRGQDYREIAASLFVSHYTVRSHLRNIYKKLAVNNQRELIHLYTQFKARKNCV